VLEDGAMVDRNWGRAGICQVEIPTVIVAPQLLACDPAQLLAHQLCRTHRRDGDDGGLRLGHGPRSGSNEAFDRDANYGDVAGMRPGSRVANASATVASGPARRRRVGY
jgi:hypothetical protein